ncbi:hypothetical protein FRC04_004657 [Tulasnella sp. 424]|nr:hypothetical protein FRC04_004657 [Tulasnella sp. 424]
MPFIVKASYEGDTRRWTQQDDVFPSYQSLSDQIPKVFKNVDNFYLTGVTFSPSAGDQKTNPSSSVLIANTVNSADEWVATAAARFLGVSYPTGMLKFSVNDKLPDKEAPIRRGPWISKPVAPTPLPTHSAVCDVCQKIIIGSRHRCIDCPDYDLCDQCIVSRRDQHDADHKFYELKEPGEIIPSPNPRHHREPSRGPHFGGLATSSPTPPNLPPHLSIHRAIIIGGRHRCLDCSDYDLCDKCIQSRRDKHDADHEFYELKGPGEIIPSPNPRHHREPSRGPHFGGLATSSPTPPNLPPHLSIHRAVCDVCQKIIIGGRHRCLDCSDYDLCNQCIVSRRDAHDADHEFYELKGPGEIIPSPNPRHRREPSRGPHFGGLATSSPTPPNLPPHLPTHSAVCDVCQKIIIGSRHRCLDCSDYDLCDQCIVSRRDEHDADHEFYELKEPSEIIVRNSTRSSLISTTREYPLVEAHISED